MSGLSSNPDELLKRTAEIPATFHSGKSQSFNDEYAKLIWSLLLFEYSQLEKQ